MLVNWPGKPTRTRISQPEPDTVNRLLLYPTVSPRFLRADGPKREPSGLQTNETLQISLRKLYGNKDPGRLRSV